MVDKSSPADDIVAFRDDVPTSSEFRKALQRDCKMLLALANARLLALALSLQAESDQDAKWPLAPDEELISYLLNTLPDHKRRELEADLKGNPRAFKRLLELHHALAGEAGQEVAAIPSSWQHVESREQLGTARFRPANGHLEFAPDDVMRSRLDLGQGDVIRPEDPELRAIAKRLVALRSPTEDPQPPIKRARSPSIDVSKAKSLLGSQTAEPLRDLLGAAERLRDALQVAKKMSRMTSPEDFERISALVDSARELADRVSRVANTILPVSKGQQQFPQYLGNALQSHAALQASYSKFSFDAAWQSSLRLHSTDMLISVTGSAGPPMHLQLQLEIPDGARLSGRVVTLVRPQQSFDSAETDKQGVCQLPLTAGESILLLEGDRPLELRLRSDL